MFIRLIYHLLLLVFLPVIIFMLYKPKAGAARFGKRWIEHFGQVKKSQQPFDIWIHAVSVGESNAAIPLIRKLLSERPTINILVTTTTATGYERIDSQLAGTVTHHYAPVDLWPCLELFLTRTRPKLLVIMETELWPNMLAACKRRHIPVLLVNGRLSQRSASRYGKLPALSHWLFSQLDAVFAQYQSDAQHFIDLGVRADKVQVTGSVKFDFEPDDSVLIQGQNLRQQLGVHRPVVIAASTRDNEEQMVLEAFQLLLQEKASALLILVPRHPQRFEQVYQLCCSAGFAVSRRSRAQAVTSETQIYLGDTMGELPQLYASSDIAFIGGSLVPLGGQNMLEPAALGIACLMGPSIYNFSDISKELIKQGGLKICVDQHELGRSFNCLFSKEAVRVKMAQAGRQTVSENRGAVDKTMALLKPWLST